MKNDSCTPGKPLEDDLSMSDIHQHLITLEALWIIDGVTAGLPCALGLTHADAPTEQTLPVRILHPLVIG